MNIIAYYTHDISPYFIKFWDGCKFPGIRWYGVCYVIAFIFTMFMLDLYTKKKISPLTREQNSSFLAYIVAGVILGGRIGYILLYTPGIIVDTPIEIFAVWHGGMSSHGGFIGVLIAIIVFCKKFDLKLLNLTDICSTIAPFGFFIGRIANFVNGELYGKITNVPWAVIFPQSAEINGIPHPRHPSQIYECILEGMILFLYMQARIWAKHSQLHQMSEPFINDKPHYNDSNQSTNTPNSKDSPSSKDDKICLSVRKANFTWKMLNFFQPRTTALSVKTLKQHGALTAEFLILYGVGRIFSEIFREPDAPLILQISRGQFYSIFLIIVGISLKISTTNVPRKRDKEAAS